MSNSDYFFANIPGAQFRPEINAMMKAMLSKNSSVAEPPYLHPGMWWHDTRNNLLKRRNTANNGWVTVGNPESPNFGHALVGAINTFAEQQAFAKGIKFSSSGIEGTKTSVAANSTNSNIWGGGDTIDLTGPAPLQISDVANAPQPGLWRWVIMHAAHTIKDNANLEVIGDTDHQCTDGEMVLFYSKSTVAFKVFPFRQDGKAVTSDAPTATESVEGIAEVATAAETETGTADDKFITPAKVGEHLQVPKCQVNFGVTGNILGNDDINISGIVDNGAGNCTVTFDKDFEDSNYIVLLSVVTDAYGYCSLITQNAGSISAFNIYILGSLRDPVSWNVAAWGKQV